MPRRAARNLYRRGTLYWGRLKIGGREYRRSLRTTDPKEAALRLKAWRLKLERAEIGGPETPTFKVATLRWAREILPDAVKPAVQKRYLSSIGQLAVTFGPLKVSQINSATISDYISSRRRVATNATIRRDLTALSRLLASCVAWGWLPSNPARLYDRSIIREQRAPISPPSAREIGLVVAAAPPGMALLLRLLDATGMRENEAVTLSGEDVDRQRREITLLRTKTSRPRTLAWQTPGGDATPLLRGAADHGPLFFSERGRPYANFSSNFARVIAAVERAERGAGRPFRRFRVHDLRHGFAIRALRAGWDIYSLSRHLGHTSVKTTEGYLGYLTGAQQTRAQQGVGTAHEAPSDADRNSV